MHEQYAHKIAERREEILSIADDAVRQSGRTLEDIELVAVSKTVDVPQVVAALEAGYRTFGENRPQELVRKLTGLSAINELTELPPYRFDMIGNLQTNKINVVLGRVDLVHSIGSLHLAEAVSSRAQRRIEAGQMDVPQPVLIEVNMGGEATKGGFAPREIREHMDDLQNLCGISIQGLMTMAPRGNKDVARACFAGLRELRDELAMSSGCALPELSCGMSEDFDVALAEGSTIVRLGRVVFDPEFAVR